MEDLQEAKKRNEEINKLISLVSKRLEILESFVSNSKGQQVMQKTELELQKEFPAQKFDYFLVLDFEATCDDQTKIKNQEIIEFPTVLINAKTLTKETEFHQYVKPTINPNLSNFCKELTGIQQSWVDNGLTLKDTLQKYDEWLITMNLIDSNSQPKCSFAFVTCGDWDLEKMLSGECRHKKLKKAEYFRRWINIKKVFQSFYQTPELMGMAEMLKYLNEKLIGKHHSGIDDCKNISTVLIRMAKEGCVLEYTTNKEEKNQINL